MRRVPTYRSTHESGSRSDGDESSNGPGAETDHGPLPFQPEVHQQPGDATIQTVSHIRVEPKPSADSPDATRQVGVEDGERRFETSSEAASAVEAQPSDPEEHGAQHNLRDVARFEHDTLCAVSAPFSDEVRVRQSARSGRDLDGHTASVAKDVSTVSKHADLSADSLKHTPLVSPAVDRPDPVGERVVDQGRPAEGEDHGGEHAGPLSSGTEQNCGYKSGEALLN